MYKKVVCYVIGKNWIGFVSYIIVKSVYVESLILMLLREIFLCNEVYRF